MGDAMDEFVYKLVLLGEASVGKSSLVVRFVQDQFHNHIESTIGAAFFTKSIPVDGDDVTFEIWDTAGQERYHSLAPMYYRGAKAAIVVYDVTDPASYDRAHKWVDELKSSGSGGTVITLVGNKVDLERKVDTQEAASWAKNNGVLFVETSALTGQGVGEVFEKIARELPRGDREDSGRGGVAVASTAPAEQKKCC
eukprot:CAMPEP_0195518402 /NCGR_PEP_ID=MMETSP0794_2-20130614/12805_1 /TAXON_ID=515487 /ORGANISM="Stephanopyxis turris, Strain CCMP 815" /LENGTH=195 /DNA_ID=CAMNT_0040647355 /DNA_START=90 /DNA_END=677 /DNA_ORIENTATION=+